MLKEIAAAVVLLVSFDMAAGAEKSKTLAPPDEAKTSGRSSDSKIRRELIGSWVVPADSSDRTPKTDRMLETFREDGTYLFTVFSDPACRFIQNQVIVKWVIENGVLITTPPNGNEMRDEVLSIGNGQLKLRSLKDGMTYTRTQRDSCSTATPAS